LDSLSELIKLKNEHDLCLSQFQENEPRTSFVSQDKHFSMFHQPIHKTQLFDTLQDKQNGTRVPKHFAIYVCIRLGSYIQRYNFAASSGELTPKSD
jgi:hypothetical protein